MYFVLLAAAVAILAGVVAVAMGWGGEIVRSRRDLPAVPLRARTASAVAMLKLPVGLFGYQQEATEVALHAIAVMIAERDAEIANLREEVRRLRGQDESSAGERSAGERSGGERSAGERSAGERSARAAEPVGPDVDEVLSGHGPAGVQPSPPS